MLKNTLINKICKK